MLMVYQYQEKLAMRDISLTQSVVVSSIVMFIWKRSLPNRYPLHLCIADTKRYTWVRG